MRAGTSITPPPARVLSFGETVDVTGTFGPGQIDRTFGPDVRYSSAPEGMKQNRPPTDGMQYFGTVRIDGVSEVMTVSLLDVEGRTLFKTDLNPE